MILNKLLDKYYQKKLELLIEDVLNLYFLDYKIENKYGFTKVYLKKKTEKDTEYLMTHIFENKRALFYITNYEHTREMISKVVKEYCDWWKEKYN